MRIELAKPKAHVPPPPNSKCIIDTKGRVSYLTTNAAASQPDSSSSTSAASSTSSNRVSRSDRRQRITASRPCMQWNRSQPCRQTPCRFVHMCMLCNSIEHRASECQQTIGTQEILEKRAHTAGFSELLPLR